MANKIGLFDNLNTDFYIGGTKARIYLGDTLVYPMEPPKYMFTRTHLDGTVFEVECGKSGTTLSTTITEKNSSKSEITGTTNPATAITIGDCVTEISNSAFYYWGRTVGDLVIPDSVLKIGASSFRNCGFDGTLTLSNNLSYIGEYAFNYTYFKGDLVIPDSVTEIAQRAFYGCRSFDGTLTLPSGITEINIGTFQECKGLTGDLIIPNGVTNIALQAFDTCGFDGKLVIPSSVVNIDAYAFNDDYSPRRFSVIYVNCTIPPTLGARNFEKNTCPIYVPCDSVDTYKSATNWSAYADRIVGWDFDKNSECQNNDSEEYPFAFQRIAQNGSAYTIQCDATSAQTISSAQTRSGITAAQVSGNTVYSPEKVIFGDCCNVVNSGACNNFRYTKSFILSDSVEDVKTNAFASTYFCNEFIVGKNVKTFGNNNSFPSAISGNTDGLLDLSRTDGVTIPSGSTNLSNWADIRLGDNCTVVNYNFSSLKRPVKNFTFGKNFKIQSLNTTGTYGTFSSSELKFDVNDMLTKINVIPNYFMWNSYGYESLTLPSNITDIGSWAFNNSGTTSTLKELRVDYSSECEPFGSNFSNSKTLEKVTYGSNPRTIPNSFFSSCSALTSVTLSEGLVSIDAAAFKGCRNLPEIRIPSTLTLFSGQDTFSGCTSLTRIDMMPTIPPQLPYTSVFNATNNCPIYVPCGRGDLYRTATGWLLYASRIEEYNYDNPNINCNGEASRDDDDILLRRLKLNVAMRIDNENVSHIIAEDGKVFRRKSDGFIYGNEIYLGYTYYIGGKLLDEPHLEVPEDFEEIDEPKDENGGEE